MIEMQPVSSSNIASIGYDEETHQLKVEFIGGRVYTYYEVSREVYQELMASESKGKYLHQYIKGVYTYSSE